MIPNDTYTEETECYLMGWTVDGWIYLDCSDNTFTFISDNEEEWLN